MSKQTNLVLATYRNKIQTSLRIVIAFQSD
jgi:hypothetical protein